MATVDRTPVDNARNAFDQARQTRLQAQAGLATKQATLSQLQRTLAANDPAVQAAQSAVTAQQTAVTGAWGAEKTAIGAVSAALAAFLATDISADVARLEAQYPIVLLPLRIETRFATAPQVTRARNTAVAASASGSPELLVRIYPDEISADAHEPELSADEQAAGQAYWAAAQPNGEQLTAWQALLLKYPAPRAAWIVRLTDPSATTSPPTFYKPSGWSRAVEARLLPDRFMVIATRGGVTRQGVGTPIVEPLALSVGPDTLSSDQSPIGPDGSFKIDDAVKWTIDFDLALANGMAIRLPIDAQDLQLGFDRVIVIGVKTSLDSVGTTQRLGALLDAQHYTSGLAFVQQGTPTSNAIGTPAGYPPPDPNNAHSFSIERGSALDTASGSAAQMLTLAMGLPAGLFAHVEGANLVELTPAQQMNRVLYSSTLGYFLDQIMSPLVGTDAVNEVGQYFAQWVIPRGICSAFRVGRVPYGVLPVTSVARWQDPGATPVQARITQLIQKLRPTFVSFVSGAPHIGATNDPDQDLIDVLAMDASAREVRVRRVLGNGTWLNLLSLFDWPDAIWNGIHQTIGASVLTALGLDSASHPRVLDMNFSADAKQYNGTLVDTVDPSESAPLGARDYITWIQKATIDQLHLESLPATFPASTKQVLLYRFLRHGALAEYHWWGNILLGKYSATPVAVWKESELVAVVPGTESVLTPWQRFQSPVTLPGIGLIDVAAFFDGDYESDIRALTGAGDFRDALAGLAPLPTAELERLFTEALDAVSHRLDAWIGSLANQRLVQMQRRREKGAGCFVGAYGWVENLKPENATTATVNGQTMRTTPGGYVQGPSMAHASTAAVLRNAYLTHLGETTSPYAIDLSSSQVRMGRFVLDSVRNGQPVGAVLGYLIERALHDAHAESLIDPIRQVAPLVANQIETSTDPTDTIAARNVVDGLALRNKWKAGTLFGAGGLSPTIAHRDVLEQQLALLDRDVDAVADLLLAESVHQIVIGSTSASGAGLDALAQGVRPPDPEVARGPSGGITLTHRLAVILGQTPAPLGPGWPAAATPRAACEPRLDAWVGTLLGDPSHVRCRVQYPDNGSPSATKTVNITFDQLNLRPLDVLALAKGLASNPAASELDRRALYAAFGENVPADAAAGASFTIVYEADPSWDRATTRSVPELLDLANAVLRAVGAMRPLNPIDVLHPANASAVSDAQVLGSDSQTRAQAAVTALQGVAGALQTAVNAVPVTVPPTLPTAAQAAAIRAQLRAASSYGIAAAFPAFVSGAQEGGVSPMPLVDQASSVLTEIQSRLAQAAAKAGDAAGQAQAVFGRDYLILTAFSFPSTTASGAELGQAIGYGPTMIASDKHAVDRWFTGATRVRDALGRWRMLRMLSEASGGPPAPWNIAQLPHDPTASWVALQPAPGETRGPGRLSLLLHAPSGAPDLTQPAYGLFLDEWVETIPNATEHTGISFRYEDTAGEAPQTILIAVPPTTAPSWDLDSLVAIVNETLDNAKMRALDLQSLDPLAQVIPGIYLAANAGDDTIATNIAIKSETNIVQRAL